MLVDSFGRTAVSCSNDEDIVARVSSIVSTLSAMASTFCSRFPPVAVVDSFWRLVGGRWRGRGRGRGRADRSGIMRGVGRHLGGAATADARRGTVGLANALAALEWSSWLRGDHIGDVHDCCKVRFGFCDGIMGANRWSSSVECIHTWMVGRRQANVLILSVILIPGRCWRAH